MRVANLETICQRGFKRPVGRFFSQESRIEKADILITAVSAGLLIWAFDWAAMFISSSVWGPALGGPNFEFSGLLLQRALAVNGENGTVNYLPNCVDTCSHPSSVSGSCDNLDLSSCFTTTFSAGKRFGNNPSELPYYAFNLLKQEGTHWISPVLFSVFTAGVVLLRQLNSYAHHLAMRRVLSRTKTLLCASVIFGIAPGSYLVKHCQNAVSDAVYWQSNNPLSHPVYFAQ